MRRDENFVPRSMQTKRNLQSPSLIISEDHKWLIFAFFLLRKKRSNACSHCGHRWINKIKSQDSGKPSNFRHLLLLKYLFKMIVSIIFNSTKRLLLSLFFHFPHDIIANFHITNYLGSQWRNRLIPQLRVRSFGMIRIRISDPRSLGSW